ncbi:hypothetical protein [Photobacterium galatheae]|uniref:Uncharacterized protein n=1 Tax=Photobacterium galatheae TaxID=1654360 RepID=A0A066RT23_9GAMM|nr:hypothetical protein [Photobacterium galatheae]KDM90538.1 hypothetical protein EA58_16575 [Photobacterium galatheae]MCM0148059.1 hypothetical protein [Photobacterium galatheae]
MNIKKTALLFCVQLAAFPAFAQDSVTIDLSFQPNQKFTVEESFTIAMDMDYQGRKTSELRAFLNAIPDDMKMRSERVVKVSTADLAADGSVPIELNIEKYRNFSSENGSGKELTRQEPSKFEGVSLLATRSANGKVHYEKTLGDSKIQFDDGDVTDLLPQAAMYMDLDQKTFEIGQTLPVKMPIDDLSDHQLSESVNVLFTLKKVEDQKAYFDLKVQPETKLDILSGTNAELLGGGTMIYDIKHHYIPEHDTRYVLNTSTQVEIGRLVLSASTDISTKVTLN